MAFAWPKPTPPPPELTEPDNRAFKSPGLRLLTERLAAPGKHEILDLGAPSERNVHFFSEFRCRLHIADAYQDLRGLPAEVAGEAEPSDLARREAVLDAAVDCGAGAKLDVVLGWDLFNYLSPIAIAGLMQRLAGRCQPGTMFFLLMYTDSSIPALPSRVDIVEEHKVVIAPNTKELASCHIYPAMSLERMLPGFQLLHSYLLGDRMQDYLFSFRHH